MLVKAWRKPSITFHPVGIGLFGLNGQVTAFTSFSGGADCLAKLHGAIYRPLVGDPGEVGVLAGVGQSLVFNASYCSKKPCKGILTSVISNQWLFNPRSVQKVTTMRLESWIVGLSLTCGVALGGEPMSGLMEKALSPSELGTEWSCRVKWLFDPQASPPELFPIATNSHNRLVLLSDKAEKYISRQKAERRNFTATGLALLGAEAEIFLEYKDSKKGSWFVLHIYRYKTAGDMEAMWKRRQAREELNWTRVAGEDVIYTRAGQRLPAAVGGGEASEPSVEARVGECHVLVGPGEPKPDDPGFRFLKKQLDKLRNSTEPYAARNAMKTRP
jgi:hypothetical protein